MVDKDKQKEGHWQWMIELAAIVVFILISVILLISSILQTDLSQPAPVIDASIQATAFAMPNNGWAPLTVYFSAFGTKSTNGAIIRYEWDLDGNGSFETDATANNGYTFYTYSKAGDYVISMRATDLNGGSAQASTLVSVRLPASSSVDYWSVFDDSQVRRVDITLNKKNWEKMWENPEEKYQAQADAVVFGEELQDVGFRMRGQFSMRNSGDKKPWKIDIDAYIDGQEYKNLRQLMFLNSIGDPSLLKEKLAYEMMEFSGLPASHVSFVELWIDIRDDTQDPIFWGVYAMVERVDNKYIGNRFTKDAKGGNLYKASHAQRGPMDLIYYGDTIEEYPIQNGQYAYGKMNNEDEADYSDIVELCRTINGTVNQSEADYIQTLEANINMDAFLRYLAVNAVIDNWDSYINTGNNFYLFNNPVSERFEWIPWDLTWGENPQAALFSGNEMGMMESAPLFERAMTIEKYRNTYTAYLDLLSRYWFTTENMSTRIRKYHNMIAPYVSQSSGDKGFFGEDSMFPYDAFQESPIQLINFVDQRINYLQTAIDEELSTSNNTNER
jgi:spore coat protein H